MNYGVFQKTIVIVLMAAVLAPVLPIATPRVEAVVGTVNVNSITDPGWVGFASYISGVKGAELTWETVLKGLGWAVAKTAINSMTRSIVNWINSGFEGSPAFVQDLENNMRQLADGVAQAFATRILNDMVAIDSPFVQRAVQGAVTGYLLYTSSDAITRRLAFTLDEYTRGNSERWRQGDFHQGGWNAWFASVRICGNNPDCARFATEEELVNRIDQQMRTRLEELGWGDGLLSWRGECSSWAGQAEGVALDDSEKCYKHAVQTPGTLIEQTLGITATSPMRQLELADSIDEIVSALVSQLVTQIIGGTGLSGVSQPSQGGGRSILNAATDTSGAANPQLTAGFDEAVSGARRTITRYQEAWEDILQPAKAALQMCEDRERDTEAERLTEIVEQAEKAIERAEDADAELVKLENRITAIRANTTTDDQSSAIQKVSDDYRCLLRGGVPSPDLVDAACLETDDGEPLMPTEGNAIEAEREASTIGDTLRNEIEELHAQCRILL